MATYDNVLPGVAARGRELQRLFRQYTGRQLILTSGYRDEDKQQQLYEDYREGRSRIPAAPPGTSAHGWGLALDFSVGRPYPQDREYWEFYWRLARHLGFHALGAYDPPHIEVKNWRAVAQQLVATAHARMMERARRDPGGDLTL